MIPASFDYARATSIEDAVAQLSASNGGGKVIAGGHSLVPLMKLRLAQPSLLIDIARIPGLSGIREEGGTIDIGAATVHHDIATSSLLRERCPMLADAAAEIGDPQVRNRGTLGGSLAHADPAADYPAAMLALDADIRVQGPRGARSVKAGEFFRDLFTVDLAADELIVGIRFAPVRSAAYAKLHQRASHFAIVGVAAALDIGGGVIRSARVGLTGAVACAVRLTNVEQALAGQPATTAAVTAASAQAGSGLGAINGDLHASAEYRQAMIPVFARRALEAALKRG
jgi:aerobic carbon-monoxide dehydrogenase medium subunit